jgi:uncharacterized protein
MMTERYQKPFTRIMLALTLTALIFTLILPVKAAFADTEDTITHVYDEAELFSDKELKSLEEQCITYGTDAAVEIIILTHNNPKALYAEDYIEDFEDRLPVGDRVYLLIDMYNRDVFIEGYGKAETYLHSKRGDVILDEIAPYLTDGKYYDACLSFIKRSAAYMKDDSELNYNHNYSNTPQSANPNAPYYDETWPSDRYYSGNGYRGSGSILTNIWVQLIAAIIIGAVTVSIMAYNSGGKMTAGSNNYLDHGRSGLIGRRDDYIRTSVTRVRKPQNNNNTNNHAKGGFNSSGFRGGTSSGGRSHSSAGRKF